MANSILLEVVNNALRTVAEQMTVTMVRSAYSTIVKEMMDCSSAIFDDKGRMLAEGANVPIHLNCLGPCLNTVLTKFFSKEELNPGDIILADPDGVIVIPRKDAAVVLEDAKKFQAADEAKLAAAINGTANRAWVEKSLAEKGFEIIDDVYHA